MSESKPKTCYEQCNDKFTAMMPGRLFCKKGCDSQQNKIADCKNVTCNKVCIKSEQGEGQLWFNFLNRAPKKPDECFEACFHGCNTKNYSQ